MHHGPCIAVTMNDRLDYFGSVVNIAQPFRGFARQQFFGWFSTCGEINYLEKRCGPAQS